MLIKTKESPEPTLETLQQLLVQPALTPKQREAIEGEIRKVRAGAQGEKQAAYFIDFKLKDSGNYAVLHDLRLEHNGRVAQIDHLIIGRCLDIILVESKNIGTAIRTDGEGEFEVRTRHGWKGMLSPVEQSKRHAHVLEGVLTDLDLLPKRLGIRMMPSFNHWVLVPPECQVTGRPKGPAISIIKMDLFEMHMDEWIEKNPLSLLKACSRETIMELGRALALHHRPITMDFPAKFGMTSAAEVAKARLPELGASIPPATGAGHCSSCGVLLEAKVVTFCRANQARFHGKLFCRSCQAPKQGASCVQCGAAVDHKVVAFCRLNSRKFGKRILCRNCQPAASTPV